jgi:hypothetical protein
MRELDEVLDGCAIPTPAGFVVETSGPEKRLFVPYSLTTDDVTAILLCRRHGLLVEKLGKLTPELAGVIYATTLAAALEEN